jgi:hypothetical protein
MLMLELQSDPAHHFQVTLRVVRWDGRWGMMDRTYSSWCSSISVPYRAGLSGYGIGRLDRDQTLELDSIDYISS